MWRKCLFAIFTCCVLISVCGCNKKKEETDHTSVEVSALPEDTYSPDPSKEDQAATIEATIEAAIEATEDTKVTADTAIPEGQLTDITIYLPDDNAEYLIPTVVKTEKTPMAVIQALVDAGALPEGTEVNKCMFKSGSTAISFEEALDPDSVLGLKMEIDLSDAFAQAVEHTGTAGEIMLMGSVVNSLSYNFNTVSVMVYANGDIIETGHNVYDEPLEFNRDVVKE